MLVDSYDTNADFYLDSCYNFGKSKLNNGDYSSALTWFSKCANYSDTQEQIKETKYQYVKNNMNNRNTATFEYMKELKAANYKDSANVYNELYAWKATSVFNTNKDNKSISMDSISKYDPIYCHVTVSGGEPNGKTQVTYSVTMPNGETYRKSFPGEWGDGYSGSWFFENGLYEDPLYGDVGTLSVKYYDSQGNLIGTDSVRITY